MDFNVGDIQEAVAAAIPDRECLVWRERRLTRAALNDRTRRLANHLLSRGLRVDQARAGLRSWESGQDHVALYMVNGPEYLESMIASFKARLVPVNVNYRYVAEELLYLLRDCRARAIVFHSAFAPTLAAVLPELPDLRVLLQVRDDSGNALLPGAIEYEAALASASAAPPAVERSPDDLYVLYTGGTTGMPKGVLWRQADIYVAALGGRWPGGVEPQSMDEIVERARGGALRVMSTAPFMHAAHWSALDSLHGGNCVVVQDVTSRFDPDSVLATAERERVNVIVIVGDAFARPLVDQLRKKRYDLSHLRVLVSGGAVLNAKVKDQFLELLPAEVRIVDTVGSSETGLQASNISKRGADATTGTFRPNPGACVLSADLKRVLEPGHEAGELGEMGELGWFAQSGRVPLGYLGDREKTERTFPTVDGVRYSIPGDRARLRADGSIEVLGRDSVTINSGGEKIFAEEVEQALKHHPAVYDAVVCGRPSERWGSEVVALVKLRPGTEASEAELLAECAKHLARYKLPKAFVFIDEVVRSPAGKPDYRWARERAARA